MLTSGAFGYLFDYAIWWLIFLSLVLHTWCFLRFFPSRLRKTKLIIGNLLIFASLLGAVGLAAESHLRFVAVETDSFGVSLPARRWFAMYTRLNSLGCRDVEWEQQKPAAVRRIAFVGDSFTYGWGIKDPADRFTDLLQRQINSQGKLKAQIMNVAKPGWDAGDEIQPVTDLVQSFGVDEIVLCHVPNDIERLLPTSSDFNPIRPPHPAIINLDSSPLLDYLYRRIYLPRVPTVRGYHDWLADGYADPAIWNRQQERLTRIIEIAREDDVTLRVVLIPFLRTQGAKFDQRAIHQRLREFFESNGVPVIDLLATLESRPSKELVVSAIDAHPNETAHRLIAEEIWRWWQHDVP